MADNMSCIIKLKGAKMWARERGHCRGTNRMYVKYIHNFRRTGVCFSENLEGSGSYLAAEIMVWHTNVYPTLILLYLPSKFVEMYILH